MPRGKFDVVVFYGFSLILWCLGYSGVIHRVFHDAIIARASDAMVKKCNG